MKNKLFFLLALFTVISCEKDDERSAGQQATTACETCVTTRNTRHYINGNYTYTQTTTDEFEVCGQDSITYYDGLSSGHLQWGAGGAQWDSTTQTWVGDTALYWIETTECN